MKPTYTKDFVSEPDKLFAALNSLDWLNAKQARDELFMSRVPLVYTYGNNDFKYKSQPFAPEVEALLPEIVSYACERTGGCYNVCFLNRYKNQHKALGWHADDSPQVDPNHAIVVISLGAEREIWWKEQGVKGAVPKENRQLLRHGSLFVMPAGFQQKFFHRIPRHDRPCGVRISLTFRRYIVEERRTNEFVP